MVDYTSLPYAKWLEEANKALVEINPDSIYFGIIKDGEVISSYFNFDTVERSLILQEMLTMSVLDRFEDHLEEIIQRYMNSGIDEYEMPAGYEEGEEEEITEEEEEENE